MWYSLSKTKRRRGWTTEHNTHVIQTAARKQDNGFPWSPQWKELFGGMTALWTQSNNICKPISSLNTCCCHLRDSYSVLIQNTHVLKLINETFCDWFGAVICWDLNSISSDISDKPLSRFDTLTFQTNSTTHRLSAWEQTTCNMMLQTPSSTADVIHSPNPALTVSLAKLFMQQQLFWLWH